jgi:hypothetical protein
MLHKKGRSRPASGFYGVSANGKRWRAIIVFNAKQRSLGSFDTKQEAALAYDREARQSGGKKKPLNYESIKAAEEAAAKAQAEYIPMHPPQPKPRPASGFYGVCEHRNRWKAQICYGGKPQHLGTFDTKQKAALAYDRAARQRGKSNLLNYDSIKAAEEAAEQAQAGYTPVQPPPTQPRSRPASGFYGVCEKGKRWEVQIRYDSKQHYLGTFDTKQEAALAYDRVARQHGKKNLLNYDSIEAAEEAATQAQVGHTSARLAAITTTQAQEDAAAYATAD